MPTLLILTMLLSVFIIAVLLARVFRSRSGALRTMDLAAAFSPAIAFGAFIGACAQVALAVPPGRFVGTIITVTVGAQVAVLLLLVWHFCRKSLALSRAKTVATVIACGVVQYECGELVGLVLGKLMLATLQ